MQKLTVFDQLIL